MTMGRIYTHKEDHCSLTKWIKVRADIGGDIVILDWINALRECLTEGGQWC